MAYVVCNGGWCFKITEMLQITIVVFVLNTTVKLYVFITMDFEQYILPHF